jgi:hypothetical protein
MYQWVADEVVVVVKPTADEGDGDTSEDKTGGKEQGC